MRTRRFSMSLALTPALALRGLPLSQRERGLGGEGKKLLIVSIILSLILLSACQQPDTPLRLGVHTLRFDDTQLQQIRAAEFDTIVQVFPWREVEPTRYQYHWEMTDQIVNAAEYYDLNLIVRLDQHPAWASEVDLSLNAPPADLADYKHYVGRVVERYRGRVGAYIIWNEPNLSIEWGGQSPDPVAFTALLQAGYEAVKANDPDAFVVAAGLAPTNSNNAQGMDERNFLEAMYQAGAGDYFDVLAAHPYSFGQSPTVPDSSGQYPSFDRLVEQREIMVAHGDGYKPVWITEMGWTIAPPLEQLDIVVTPQQQADYLVEAMEIIERDWPWVELVTVWNLSLPSPGDPFGGYSMLDSEGQPRAVYEVWQQMVTNRAERGLPITPPTFHNPVYVLAPDAPLHLGDSDLQPPWWPLFGGYKPSLSWTGSFYLADPGDADWQVILELMQQNEIGATVAVNGIPLSPDLPQQDFTRRWLTTQRRVPNHLLRPGYNELTITTVRLLPDAQHDEFVWDDFQVRNIRFQKVTK